MLGLASLCRALNVSESTLQRIASKANNLYRPAKPIPKGDGTFRQPWGALEPLKPLQKRIKNVFLSEVNFPDYLTGSLQGKSVRHNVEIHAGAAIAVCEDIQKFFPSVSAPLVFRIWRGFFGFSDDVAQVLTLLTTKDGVLPEGAATSSHLANLAFWDVEPALVEAFESRDIRYSRYVDDVGLSSLQKLERYDLTWAISQLYGMMYSRGFKQKRTKHEIGRGGGRIVITKHVANKRAAYTSEKRSQIRAAVRNAELALTSGLSGPDVLRMLNSASVRVGQMALLHPNEAAKLMVRLRAARQSCR